MIEHKLKLKFDDSFNGVLFSTQGDTGRVFEIEVRDELDNAIDITGHKLEFYVGNEKKVTKVEGKIQGNKFIVRPVNEQFTKAGLNKAQFVLYDPQGLQVGSQIFELHVEESIQNGATVGANIIADFSKVQSALELIKGYEKIFEDSKKLTAEINQSVEKGEQLKESLKSGTNAAQNTNDNLTNTIASANLSKTNLDSSISKANTAKNGLDGSIDRATIAKNSLDSSTSKANTTNNNLKSTDSKASASLSTLQDLLNQSLTTEQSLREIIASGNLDKYVTEPKLQEAISKIKTLKKEIVDALPVSGQDDVIYLVKDANGKTNNAYLEYLWINNTFEIIGSTDIDLSGYAKTSEVDDKISKIDLSPYAKTSEVDTLKNSIEQNTQTISSHGRDIKGLFTAFDTYSTSIEKNKQDLSEFKKSQDIVGEQVECGNDRVFLFLRTSCIVVVFQLLNNQHGIRNAKIPVEMAPANNTICFNCYDFGSGWAKNSGDLLMLNANNAYVQIDNKNMVAFTPAAPVFIGAYLAKQK